MPSIDISFGGYQGPGSIHTAAARAFGETLEKSLGDRVRFELEPDVLAAGHKSGDLLPMTAKGDFTLCYISTIRFSQTIP